MTKRRNKSWGEEEKRKKQKMLEKQVLEDIFQDLHRHPELAKEEIRTTMVVRQKLQSHHIKILDLPLSTGLIAEVGKKEGPVIALRCDLDALPVTEATGLSYASEVPGKMHACGHDFHTTAVMGAALLLKERESQLQGRVRFVFQPGEEINYGAKAILETGILDDIMEIYGLHVDPDYPVGVLGIREGAIMASPDRFRIIIHGKGGHAAQPQNCIDPVPCMASMILALQHIVSRRINPHSSAVLSVTKVNTGNTWNVIPAYAELEGTIRTFSEENRDLIEQLIHEVAISEAKTYACRAETFFSRQSRPLINTKEQTMFADMIAQAEGFQVVQQEPSMIGEDFAEYLKTKPGCFIRVGTGRSEALHHPGFIADPEALYPVVQFLAKLITERLIILG